jgi:TatA/E family protein of Tat protein translocase
MFGSLGVSEILLILVIALIVFGPRKLPQLGRSLGESLAQFRKASEDFKRTWEQEITVEEKRLSTSSPSASAPSSEKEPTSESKNEQVSESLKQPVSESKS